MQDKNIEKLVEQTLESFHNAKRAEPKPFLLTRVLAAINNQYPAKNAWANAGAFISRPGIAIAGIACIAIINFGILLFSKYADKPTVVQNDTVLTDDFAVNAANIYDVENADGQ